MTEAEATVDEANSVETTDNSLTMEVPAEEDRAWLVADSEDTMLEGTPDDCKLDDDSTIEEENIDEDTTDGLDDTNDEDIVWLTETTDEDAMIWLLDS